MKSRVRLELPSSRPTYGGAAEGWDGAGTGAADGVCASELLVGRRIALPMLREFLPPPRPASQAGAPSDRMVMVCGTDCFVEALAGPTTREPPDPVTGKKGKKVQGPLTGHLAELGYTAEEVYKF